MEFQWDKHEFKTGYLEPRTTTLHWQSPRVNCHTAPSIHLSLGHALFEYRTPNLPVRIPTETAIELPFLRSNLTQYLVTFPDNWIFGNDDLNHIDRDSVTAAFMNDQLKTLENEQYERARPETPHQAVPEVNQERKELESNSHHEKVYPPPNIMRALTGPMHRSTTAMGRNGKETRKHQATMSYLKELPTLERNYFEPKFKAMYNQTTMKKPSRTVPPAPTSLRNLSTRHFNDL